MNILSVILLWLLPTIPVEKIVTEFHELNTRESEAQFMKTYISSADPSILAYVYAIEMKQAEYGYNPISKLAIFNKFRKKLDSLIKSNPTNVHLRYVRLVVQEKTPSILGYKSNIPEDKIFLSQKLKVTDDSDYLDVYILAKTSL
jgi:hypothetical protein